MIRTPYSRRLVIFMASEALSIPIDISWKRLAWSRDMLDRGDGALPAKWRSSLTIYAYPVALEETEDEYPDERIVYLKVSASITGWTAREEIPTREDLSSPLDGWHLIAAQRLPQDTRFLQALGFQLPRELRLGVRLSF